MMQTGKILAIILAFCMVFALTVPAAASGDAIGPAEAAGFTEEATADGWIRVTQDNGPTLGYSPDSGVTLLTVDGFVFKDLDKDGELDVYEDWREDARTRAEDLAARLVEDESFRQLCRTVRGQLSDLENRVWWPYVTGVSVSEIARDLGRDERSVHNAIYRIRRKLRAHLSQNES